MTLKERISAFKSFFSVGIWKTTDEAGFKGFAHRALRVFLITIQEFQKDKIPLQASAMTYLSLLSVVPLLALVFGVTKGFGHGINIQEEITTLFPAAQDVVFNTTFEWAQKMLDNAKGGVIAGVGTLVLFFTVMRLLNNIEDVFNIIWGKQRSRSWIRKFTDYLAILVVAPILIILSSSATAFATTQIKEVGEKFDIQFLSGPLAVVIVNLSPYILIWILFTLVYIIMPNRRVHVTSGMWAGILAGTAFQFIQWGFINLEVMVAKYNAIYGSLAALPLFIIFTQLSWTIVFFGGEFCFALEKREEYIPDEKDIQFSYNERKRIALIVMKQIIAAFEKREDTYSKKRLAEELAIPHRFVSNAINRLVDAQLLVKSLPEGESEHRYTPSFDINKIDIQIVADRLENDGEGGIFTDDKPQFKALIKSVDEIHEASMKSNGNKLIKDIT